MFFSVNGVLKKKLFHSFIYIINKKLASIFFIMELQYCTWEASIKKITSPRFLMGNVLLQWQKVTEGLVVRGEKSEANI